jgi:hypothetical protein
MGGHLADYFVLGDKMDVNPGQEASLFVFNLFRIDQCGLSVGQTSRVCVAEKRARRMHASRTLDRMA